MAKHRKSRSNPATTIEAAKERHEARLLRLPGVAGVGITERDGQLAITVYVERLTAAIRERIGHDCDGFPIRVEKSGRFDAF